MVAVYLSPLYLAANLYFLWRILRWMGACARPLQKKWVRVLISAVYAFFALSLLIAFWMPAGAGRRIMKLLSNYWLGVLLYMGLAIVLADLCGLVVRLIRKKKGMGPDRRAFAAVGALCAVTVAAVSVWGVVQAAIIRVTPYEITVDKKAGELDSLRIVLTADLHLGYNIGIRRMEKMVERINEQDPDLVVIAGDIFDNEFEAVEDPQKMAEVLRGIKSRYGVYACYGNHDVQEPILAGFTFAGDAKKQSSEEMDDFLKQAGINLLRDEAVLIANSVYLYGRPDAQRPGRGIEARKTPEEITADMDLSKPVIVIDHQPRELQELSDAGVDVDLCGHTHDGQMFPGNILVSMMWENSYGYRQKGKMHNIVTSGVGLFGPNMRVGTKAEICPVTVHFE